MGSSTESNTRRTGQTRQGTPEGVRQNHDLNQDERKRVLARTLLQDIIPRLVNSHPLPQSPALEDSAAAPFSAQEVLEFAHLVLHSDDATLQKKVQALRLRGITHQRLLLDLLTPVAAHMGRLWEHDDCDFHDVTLAVGRLQRLLPDHGAKLAQADSQDRPTRRILLTTCAGEQHTFGLSMVAEFFVQAGWDVATAFLASDAPPQHLVREQWFDVVGLSLGSSARLPEFTRLAQGLRKASLNQAVSIIAGGPVLTLLPVKPDQLMVDAVITDASQAPALAEQLLASALRKVPAR